LYLTTPLFWEAKDIAFIKLSFEKLSKDIPFLS
ncbi:hypothetical protein SFB5_270G0, partial [Candidatus Arthromitus sp. SFB-5]